MRKPPEESAPSALTLRTWIAEGRQTAQSVVEDTLARIAKAEPWLRAFVHVDEKSARVHARNLDAGTQRGPLHGVPIGVKDIFAVKDMPWRSGSPIWENRAADFDAPSVALSRKAGAVVLGKTVTTEFAGYKSSVTRNPKAPTRSSGGSSSGSAAAVAAGLVPLALGTQTSGSIIRPASYCGVVGFKPSFDLIDGYGVTALARSFDTVGLFARDVPDIALGASALSGISLPIETLIRPRISLYRSVAWVDAEPELQTAWIKLERELSSCASLTHTPFEPSLDREMATIPPLHARMMASETRDALAHEFRIAPDKFSPVMRDQIRQGAAVSAEQRHSDRLTLARWRARMLQEVDPQAVWVTPAATGPAPLFEDGTGNPAFNRTWSFLGLPCCSIPILSGSDGAPIGVQVVGAMGNDAGVLSVAHWLMQAVRL